MSSGQRWLITGGSGLLGSWCVRAARAAGHDVTAQHHTLAALPLGPEITWRAVDLTRSDDVTRLVQQTSPAVVIHTAAMAQPRDCELDPERAHVVNVRAAAELASATHACGGRFIHLSSDLVFAGDQAPYDENDPRTPIHVYGRTKAQSEDEVAARCPNNVVVRTSLQVGPSPRGNRGIEEVLATAVKRGERPQLFTDEFRQPMASEDLAAILVWLGGQRYAGVLHVAGPERLSRHAIGVKVAEAFGFPSSQLDAVPLSSAPQAFPHRAPDVTLRLDRLRALGPPLWPRRLSDVLATHPLAKR
ncbi:MAG: SDR family oxidoreductase [Myxococcota bacterium]